MWSPLRGVQEVLDAAEFDESTCFVSRSVVHRAFSLERHVYFTVEVRLHSKYVHVGAHSLGTSAMCATTESGRFRLCDVKFQKSAFGSLSMKLSASPRPQQMERCLT